MVLLRRRYQTRLQRLNPLQSPIRVALGSLEGRSKVTRAPRNIGRNTSRLLPEGLTQQPKLLIVGVRPSISLHLSSSMGPPDPLVKDTKAARCHHRSLSQRGLS